MLMTKAVFYKWYEEELKDKMWIAKNNDGGKIMYGDYVLESYGGHVWHGGIFGIFVEAPFKLILPNKEVLAVCVGSTTTMRPIPVHGVQQFAGVKVSVDPIVYVIPPPTALPGYCDAAPRQWKGRSAETSLETFLELSNASISDFFGRGGATA